MTEAQRIIDEAVAAGVPGVQAFVRAGSSVWAGVSGLSSIEHQRSVVHDDRVRLASITKMFTYAATSALIREGALRLADRAIDHLPRGALADIPHADEITIDHLLEHTSGLHNFNGPTGGDFFAALFAGRDWGQRMWSAAELLAFARDERHAPTGPPGESGSYSSTGYIVLEMILEHVTQDPFAEVFRSLVFAPLDMSRTAVEGQELRASDIADSYAIPDADDPSALFAGRPAARADGVVNLSSGLKYMNAWARAAGACASTAEDLGRFMDAVIAGEVIVLRDQHDEFQRARAQPGRAYGWNGGSWGIQATIRYEPHRASVAVVLKNASNVGPSTGEIATRLAQAG